MTFNVYAAVILAAILVDYVLGTVSGILNIGHAADTVPPGFEGVYSPAAYAKSQRYLRTTTRFGIVVSSVGLAATLAFWFPGGFGWLDRTVREALTSPIPRGLAFIGGLLVLRMGLSVPASVYSTFVIEEHYGFNRTRWGTFVLDRIKALLLAVILGAPLLAGILFVFRHAGWSAWLYCWGMTTVFAVVVQFIAPVWLFPLFNRFTPLADGDLRQAIMALCSRLQFPVTNVFAIDGSRRSSRSNAYVAGFGRHKRIALYDTLIEQHTVDELVAVVAHEIGHWRHKHIWKGLVIGIVHSGIVFYLLSIFLTHRGLFDAFGVQQSVYAGLVFFGMLYAPVEMGLGLAVNALSRGHEYEADRFAAEVTPPGDALQSALKKLSVNNLGNLTPHPLTVALEYSHPPVAKRIAALMQGDERNAPDIKKRKTPAG